MNGCWCFNASVLWAKLIKIAKKCSFRNYLIQFYCLSPHLIDVKASSRKKDSIAVQLMFFQSMAPLNKVTVYKSHGDLFVWKIIWDLWAFHPIFCFSFWLTKLPKMKIACVIFCTMFFVCKARQARWKWKKILSNNFVFS